MKKFFLYTAILLMPIVVLAQDLKPDLTAQISADTETTWLDCAREVFPDATYVFSTLRVTNSIQIRSLATRQKPIKVQRIMKIVEFRRFAFNDKDELRLGILFRLENQYGYKMPLDVLAIYKLKPGLELLDAVSLNLENWQTDKVDFEIRNANFEFGDGKKLSQIFHFINRRQISFKTSEEKNRFLTLENGKLQTVLEFPVMTNYKFCNKEVSHRIDLEMDLTGLPQITVRRATDLIMTSDCTDTKHMGFATDETYGLKWDAKRQILQKTLTGISRFAVDDMGKKLKIFQPYRGEPVLKLGRGYRAQVFYYPETKEIDLAFPSKFNVTFDFYDQWKLAPKDAKDEVRRTVDFQVYQEEIKISPDGRREVVYSCLIYAFDKRRRVLDE